MQLEVAALTHKGMVRENNEDAYLAFEPENEHELSDKGRLYIVADGMGGHRGGEIASQLAVDTILSAYYSSDDQDRVGALCLAFDEANRIILNRSVEDTTLFGMGTTCTAMLVIRGEAQFAHVGDSRAYLCRDDQLTQLTRDHSLVGEMVRSGMITDEDARHHPKRHVITRSLGIHQAITADTLEKALALQVGDVVLLCSDGLTSLVGDDEIWDAISKTESAAACQKLVDLANDAGGKDNVTVQVIRVA